MFFVCCKAVVKVQQQKRAPKALNIISRNGDKIKTRRLARATSALHNVAQHTHTDTHTHTVARRALWQLLTCDTATQISRQRKRKQLPLPLRACVCVSVSCGVTTYSKMSFGHSLCCRHCWRLTTTTNPLTLQTLIMEIKNLANM